MFPELPSMASQKENRSMIFDPVLELLTCHCVRKQTVAVTILAMQRHMLPVRIWH